MIFNICLDNNDGTASLMKVRGQQVRFSTLRRWRFAVHPSPDTSFFHVSELSTGFKFAVGETPREAIDIARAIVEERGFRRFARAMRKARKKRSVMLRRAKRKK